MRDWKRAKWRERSNTRREQGKGRGSKQTFIFWAPTCPPPFSLSRLPALLFVWLLGVFYHHALFILNSSVFIPLLSVKKLLSSIIFKPTLFVSPNFSLHFLPCLSIIVTVKSLLICCLTYTLYSIYSICWFPFTHFFSFLSLLRLFIEATACVASSRQCTTYPWIAHFYVRCYTPKNNHIILQNSQSSSMHAPASYKHKAE